MRQCDWGARPRPGSPACPACHAAALPAPAQQSPASPAQSCPCSPLPEGPKLPPRRRGLVLFSSFSSFSQASVAARPRTRGPPTAQQSNLSASDIPSQLITTHIVPMSWHHLIPDRGSSAFPHTIHSYPRGYYYYYCCDHQRSALLSAPPASHTDPDIIILCRRYVQKKKRGTCRYSG